MDVDAAKCLRDQPDGAEFAFGRRVRVQDDRFRWGRGLNTFERRSRLGFECMDVDSAKCLRDQSDGAEFAFGHC